MGINSVFKGLNSVKNNGYFTWRPLYIFLSYLAHLFLEQEML